MTLLHAFKTFVLISLSLIIIESKAQQKDNLPKEKKDDIERNISQAAKYEKLGNYEQAIFYLNRVAFIYWENGGLKQAIKYFLESVPLNEKIGNYNDIKAIYSNVGSVYCDLEQFDLAIDYYKKSLEIRQKLKSNSDIVIGLYDLAYTYGLASKYDKAIEYLNEAFLLSSGTGNPRMQLNILQLLGYCYDKTGNSVKVKEISRQFDDLIKQQSWQEFRVDIDRAAGNRNAFSNREKEESQPQGGVNGLASRSNNDSMNNAAFSSRQKQQESEIFESFKKMQEQAKNEREERIKAQQTTIYISIAGLSILFILTLIVINSYLAKRKVNKVLHKKNEEINLKNEQIQRQSESISRSINYAQSIQKSLLPDQKLLNEYFDDAFIYFKPRDMVSGDYYWFKPLVNNGQYNNNRDKIAISATDCTGHGVPGAFMSLIGCIFLDDITDRGTHNPGEILDELDKGVRKRLRQDETPNRDGMDMALCVWNPIKKTLDFAGAKNSLVYVKNNTIYRIRGNKESVGGGVLNYNYNFTTHSVYIDAPTWVYLFTDGFIDQFGGKDGNKFMMKNFIHLLEHISTLSGSEQREILKITYNEWKDNRSQVDDVLVLGFKIE